MTPADLARQALRPHWKDDFESKAIIYARNIAGGLAACLVVVFLIWAYSQ